MVDATSTSSSNSINVTPSTINNTVEVGDISASAQNAKKAQIWAEGADQQVTPLGGEHSAKGWAYVAKEWAGSIGQVMHYKGSVANYAALQAIVEPALGDTYNVLDTGSNYAWDGTSWDQLSGIVDLSAYRTAAAQDVIDAGKQSLLVSGENIKSINDNSLLGSGNITIDSLPSQSGNSGKYLTTNGSEASWAELQVRGAPTLTWYTGNTGTSVTIVDTTDASLVKIYKNGLLLQPTQDYTISGTTITLTTDLVSADKITVEVF